jgi:sugar O-acyltransferase (sialic acid O-acetyltransferase NeuD family)
MILAGAGGHARELIDLLDEKQKTSCFLFDNVTTDAVVVDGTTVIRTEEAATEQLKSDDRFVPATGSPAVRKKLFNLFLSLGGTPYSIVATTANISTINVHIGAGANIMHFVFISNHVHIGDGCLINTRANIHHDVSVGNFCEIGPGALLLGKVRVADEVLIGAGAILLPGISVGKGAVIGAGSVVTKKIEAGVTVKGNPAV